MSDEELDRQDQELAKKTTQVDPVDEIQSDSDLEDEIGNIEDLQSTLEDHTSEKDWVSALEVADQLQELSNRIHAYIAGKIE